MLTTYYFRMNFNEAIVLNGNEVHVAVRKMKERRDAISSIRFTDKIERDIQIMNNTSFLFTLGKFDVEFQEIVRENHPRYIIVFKVKTIGKFESY